MFVKRLKDKEIKKEMKRKATARKDLMIKKIIELVKRHLVIYILFL